MENKEILIIFCVSFAMYPFMDHFSSPIFKKYCITKVIKSYKIR